MTKYAVFLPGAQTPEFIEADSFKVDEPSHVLTIYRGDKSIAAFVGWMGIKEASSQSTDKQ